MALRSLVGGLGLRQSDTLRFQLQVIFVQLCEAGGKRPGFSSHVTAQSPCGRNSQQHIDDGDTSERRSPVIIQNNTSTKRDKKD